MKYLTVKSIPSFVVTSFVAVLVGCGGGSDTAQENPRGAAPELGDTDNTIVYNGPVAATEDVTQFRINLWENMVSDDRCGGCHNEVVGQEPMFMRRDDINLAYEATLPYVDKDTPVLSRLYIRAEEGHNPWNDSAADTIAFLIDRWAQATGASENTIALVAPEVREIGNIKQFPVESDLYATTIYPLVTSEAAADCVSCHSESSSERQQPFFASASVDTAYAAARTLIDLENAGSSRFVQRVQEGHKIWENPATGLEDQAYSVQDMLDAVNDFISQVEEVEVDPNLMVSNALDIEQNGLIVSSGGRFDTDVIALYQFREGEGSTAFDISGIEPSLDLTLSPSVEWVGSWGIRILDNGKAQGTPEGSKKLNDLIKLTGEYSIEAWVIPATVTDEEARIITYSGSSEQRNFSLHQNLYDYDFLARTENSDTNGMPLINTPSADEVLQATLQHVVATYDAIEGRKIYVNGELIIEDPDAEFAGNINDWNDSYVLAVGNEVDNVNGWTGTVRMLAIHNRVLNQEQITGNFEAGVGQKYYLLFGVSHLINTDSETLLPEAYVVFSVEQYDDYSYLFSSPFFISLDRDAVPSGDINIQGIRIGINGREATVGQAYANVDLTINASNYDSGVGVPLSPNPAGTLIGLENGQRDDLFFLSFDSIGGNDTIRIPEPTPSPIPDVPADAQPDVGLRIFDEVFQNMSAITTVPSERIYDFYVEEIRRSLPSAESAVGFLSSQQSAITQLSLAYCTELVEDDTLNNSYFGDYGDLSTTEMQDALIDPLLEKMLLSEDADFEDHPSAADIKAKLVDPAEDGLLTKMTTNNQDTKAIAVCTSVLAGAAMLMQ